MPPFNTAIVKDYNALTGARVKLGRWGEYLAMDVAAERALPGAALQRSGGCRRVPLRSRQRLLRRAAQRRHTRAYDGGRLADGCLPALPEALERRPGAEAVRLIDVLWLDGTAAFEVEHTTSIYSGIVRLLDLALSWPSTARRSRASARG